jgi:GT2 family glycosyltransferase
MMLTACLEALESALEGIDEPRQCVVVVNGSEREEYRGVVERFGWVEFQFHEAALPFSRAVESGLAAVKHEWVYLLNSDMLVEKDTLRESLQWRAPNVFAIGSQIFLQDPTRRRVETNLTELRVTNGLVDTWDVVPGDPAAVQDCVYAGGGSSLFQTALLRRFVKHFGAYDPFYWEDVEGGLAARRLGYRTLFCGSSRAWHGYRKTVERYYSASEIERIFERNRTVFQLRNPDAGGTVRAVLAVLARRTPGEVWNVFRAGGILRSRFRAAATTSAGATPQVLYSADRGR